MVSVDTSRPWRAWRTTLRGRSMSRTWYSNGTIRPAIRTPEPVDRPDGRGAGRQRLALRDAGIPFAGIGEGGQVFEHLVLPTCCIDLGAVRGHGSLLGLPRSVADGFVTSNLVLNSHPEDHRAHRHHWNGIAGMTAAHLLRARHDVHVFEADDRPGGHANTVTVDLRGGRSPPTPASSSTTSGPIPSSRGCWPSLGVATHPSEMSFSLTDLRCGLEWRGTSLSTVFAQRRNVARPAFLAMLADVVRFNRLSRALLAETGAESGTLADLLAGRRWSAGFLDWYLIPLGSAIWSADPETFTQIPARTFAEFFSRHGLLGPGDQPAWRTVTGGSARYVAGDPRAAAPPGAAASADRVSKLRRQAAGSSSSQRGTHRLRPCGRGHAQRPGAGVAGRPDDARSAGCSVPCATSRTGPPSIPTRHCCPPTAGPGRPGTIVRPEGPTSGATLTYYLNRLQGLQAVEPVLVTLNRDEAIDPEKVVAQFDYAHPVVDQAAVAAQSSQRMLSAGAVSYCGAYWGYGFHEDGVRSALAICEDSARACDGRVPADPATAQRALRGNRDAPARRARSWVRLPAGDAAPLPRRSGRAPGRPPPGRPRPVPPWSSVARRHAFPPRGLPALRRGHGARRSGRSRGGSRRIRARPGGDAGAPPHLGLALQPPDPVLLLRPLRPGGRVDGARGVQHPVARALPLRRRAAG